MNVGLKPALIPHIHRDSYRWLVNIGLVCSGRCSGRPSQRRVNTSLFLLALLEAVDIEYLTLCIPLQKVVRLDRIDAQHFSRCVLLPEAQEISTAASVEDRGVRRLKQHGAFSETPFSGRRAMRIPRTPTMPA